MNTTSELVGRVRWGHLFNAPVSDEWWVTRTATRTGTGTAGLTIDEQSRTSFRADSLIRRQEFGLGEARDREHTTGIWRQSNQRGSGTEGKILNQLQPLPRVGPKSWWTLVHKRKKVIDVHIEASKWIFFGILHFGPYGMLPPKLLYALEINQGLLAHTTRGLSHYWPWKDIHCFDDQRRAKFRQLSMIFR